CHAPYLLIQLNPAPELLVFVADKLDQLLVGQEPLVYSHSPRFGVGLRIVDGKVDLQMAERWTPEALGDLRFPRVRAAVYVEPAIEWTVFRAAQVVGLDDQIVAVP